MPGSIVATFKALGDPTRLKMLALLRIRDLCVCEFVGLFGLSQPSVSQHLRRLKEAGLVTSRRQGMWVIYHLADELPPYAAAAIDALPSFPALQEGCQAIDLETACAAREAK